MQGKALSSSFHILVWAAILTLPLLLLQSAIAFATVTPFLDETAIQVPPLPLLPIALLVISRVRCGSRVLSPQAPLLSFRCNFAPNDRYSLNRIICCFGTSLPSLISAPTRCSARLRRARLGASVTKLPSSRPQTTGSPCLSSPSLSLPVHVHVLLLPLPRFRLIRCVPRGPCLMCH